VYGCPDCNDGGDAGVGQSGHVGALGLAVIATAAELGIATVELELVRAVAETLAVAEAGSHEATVTDLLGVAVVGPDTAGGKDEKRREEAHGCSARKMYAGGGPMCFRTLGGAVPRKPEAIQGTVGDLGRRNPWRAEPIHLA
ncbi:MAG: hypothetical protein ABL886_12955, partial [Rhodoglobus sp.]